MLSQTSESFWSEMVRLIRNPMRRKYSAYAFDVAWVIALTLNASMANGLTYERLNKRTYDEVGLITKWMRKTNFEGITVSKKEKKKIKQSCTFSWVDTSMSSLTILNRSSLKYTLMFFKILLPYSWFPGYGILKKNINGIQDRILWGKINSIRLFRSDNYPL